MKLRLNLTLCHILLITYLDVDVSAHSDEDSPDEEEEEVEDGHELVEHAVATVVHLSGSLFSGPAPICLQYTKRNVIAC